MNYAIQTLKEKLRQEVIAEEALTRGERIGHSRKQTLELTMQRRLDLEKALEVLMRENK